MNKEKKEQQIDNRGICNSTSSTLNVLFIIHFVSFKDSECLPLDVKLLVTLLISSTSQWCSEQVKK